MNDNVRRFFHASPEDSSPSGNFHTVIALHDSPHTDWENVSQKIPGLPRAWFELSGLDREDRIELVQERWLDALPFQPKAFEKIEAFFDSLDDVGIFLTQQVFEGPLQAQMVYSVSGNNGFFRGYPPYPEENLEGLRTTFQEHLLPQDYLAFLAIHNGFGKSTDTGVIPVKELHDAYETLQEHLEQKDLLVTPNGEGVNIKELFPFYESFGLHSYQCFYGEWYADQEMGNLFYCGREHSLSDYQGDGSPAELQAFPTFLDWLAFYLEQVVSE